MKKIDTFQQTTELKEKLQDLLSDPESDETTQLIEETQQQLETHETKVLYNLLAKKSQF
jgi:hypothetical protein